MLYRKTPEDFHEENSLNVSGAASTWNSLTRTTTGQTVMWVGIKKVSCGVKLPTTFETTFNWST